MLLLCHSLQNVNGPQPSDSNRKQNLLLWDSFIGVLEACFGTRHVSTCLDMSRHVSTCLDMSRHVSTCLNTYIYIYIYIYICIYIHITGECPTKCSGRPGPWDKYPSSLACVSACPEHVLLSHLGFATAVCWPATDTGFRSPLTNNVHRGGT